MMKHSDRADLIAGLNEDLAHEYASIIRYRTFASTVRGLHRLTLRDLFAREIGDELSHAGLLADAIVALGATPTVKAAEVAVADVPTAMLRYALEAERDALARYAGRRRQAEAAGEHGLAIALDALIADEARHRDELQLVLSDSADSAQAGEPDGRSARHDRSPEAAPASAGPNAEPRDAAAGGDLAVIASLLSLPPRHSGYVRGRSPDLAGQRMSGAQAVGLN